VARPAASAAHVVRLVGGHWRRSRLPVADAPGLRPTPERVRETLFNWLGQDLKGWRVLDAFAGSGALGLEAASRGAASVTLLERAAPLAASLRATVQRLQGGDPLPDAATVQVFKADALTWMRAAPPQCLDLVLLDPPFDSGLQAAAVAAAWPLLALGGHLYLESQQALTDWPPGAQAWRQLQAGAVHAQLVRRTA
jgi:16S rRNA (guanine966-N2)-methyltransferase